MSKVLLIAPGCNGEDVGEAWVGFQWASRLSLRHDLTVLTHYKRGLTPAVGQLPRARVVEWREPPLLGRAERFNSMLKPAYVVFYRRARRWIREALARGERFDLAHQVVPVAMRYPSPAADLGVPLVLGPVGGGMRSPPAFGAEEGTAPWFVGLRKVDQWRLHHDPWLRRTYRTADRVLGIAPYVEPLLNGVGVRRFETLSETALESLPPEVNRAQHAAPFRLLYVGRLIRTKGARDAIRAVDAVRALDIHLDVVGDGPDRRSCEDLVDELDLRRLVTFHGALSRRTVDDFYRTADAFVFPSYREPGGNVVPEAMGFGLPVIVTDRGGPGSAADDSCGFRLPVTTPEALARDIASAISTLVTDPELARRMGGAARARAERTALWDSRIESIEAIYRSVLDGAADDRTAT